MATSSITHNFVITDVKKFLDAIEQSEQKCTEDSSQLSVNTRTVTDSNEIKEICKNIFGNKE